MKTTVVICLRRLLLCAPIWIMLGTTVFRVCGQDCTYWVCRFNGQPGNGVGSPGQRVHHAMAYDPDRGVTVFFGGEIGTSGSESYFNDTWEYDGTNAWHQINVPGAKPSPRSFSAMVYDRARHYVLLHGGQSGGNSYNDTWAYTSDGVTGTWTPLPTDTGSAYCLELPKLAGHAMIYNPVNGVSMMIGGYDGIYTSNQQKQSVWPVLENGAVVDCTADPATVTYFWDGNWYGYAFNFAGYWPYIRYLWYVGEVYKFAAYGIAAAFDDYHGVAIGVGGYTQAYEKTQLPSGYFTFVPDTNCYKNCWSNDGTPGWEYNPDTSLPPPLAEASMAYDSQRHHIVLVGGVNVDATDAAYDYVYTGNRTNRTGIWSTLPSIPPNPLNGASSARAGAAMVYDSRRGVFVLMGGAGAGAEVDIPLDVPRGPGSRFSDVWELVVSGAGVVASSQGEFDHCVGDTEILSVTPSGLNSTIQWYHNAVAIPNATHELLVLNNLAVTDAGNYVARVQNDCGYADTPKTYLRVDQPITLFRQALFPNCSSTCIGSNVTIYPPLPVYTGIDLNTHLQKNIGSAEFPTWVDVRVDTPSAPANFVFTNVDESFSGDYRFYIDGSACTGIVASAVNHIQVGFDITAQPQSLSNVRPCSTVMFSVGTSGGCGLAYSWYKTDDGHIVGSNSPTLTLVGVHYDDEGGYACVIVDTNQCNNTLFSTTATLKLTLPQWVLRTTNGPSPRYANTMAYDRSRQVTVMYSGGHVDPTFGYRGFGDVWEWNGARWRQRTTYSQTNAWHRDNNGYWVQNYGDTPAARLGHAMSYDSRRGRVVMFGGRGGPDTDYGDYVFNDTWEWDGTRWYFRTTNGPPARTGHHMGYDPVRAVTVLYGGFGASSAQVWEWDGTNWTSVSPTNGPCVAPFSSYNQNEACLVFDTYSGTLFGGATEDGRGFDHFYWGWDGHDWHSRAQGFLFDSNYTPVDGNMVYDTYRLRALRLGGRQNGLYNQSYGGTAAGYYDSASDTWSVLPDEAATSCFNPTDFVNVSSLVGKLSAQGDPVSQYLWTNFTTMDQQTLTNFSVSTSQKQTTLAAALNNIITNTAVYDSNRFAAISLSLETTVFKDVNPVIEDLVRFNRLLIEDAYPAEVARSLSCPTGRGLFGMAFDPARRCAVVMGGYYYAGYTPLTGSDTWELMYLDTPLINDQPASQYRAPGDAAVFTVNAVAPYGTTLSYQWYFGAVPLKDSGRISGANSPTLRLANVTAADAGQYQALISAACGTIYTTPAILTTDPRLQIFSPQQGAAELVWSAANLILQQADSLSGPWTTVPGATSPFDLSLEGPGKFFRLTLAGH